MTLEERQQQFQQLFTQWRSLVCQFLVRKGIPAGSVQMNELVDRFSGRAWAEFDKWNPCRGSFNAWLGWNFKAWWRDRGISFKLTGCFDQEKLQLAKSHDTFKKSEPWLKPTLKGLAPGTVINQRGNEVLPKRLQYTADPTREAHLRNCLRSLSVEDQALIEQLEQGHSPLELSQMYGITRKQMYSKLEQLRRRVEDAIDRPKKKSYEHHYLNEGMIFWIEYMATQLKSTPHWANDWRHAATIRTRNEFTK